MFCLKKFTLLELLIVLSILGILISILLPSLKGAKEKALATVCMSNLKQIGVGVYLYAKDNAGYIPTSNIDSTAPFSPGMIYYTAKYVLNQSVNKQEALELKLDMRGTIFDEPVLMGNNKGGINDPVVSGYGWNWRYMGYKQNHANDVFDPKILAGIDEPSERMLAGDTSDTTHLEGHRYFRYQNVGNRHQNSINVLITDGSVESVNSFSLQNNNNSKWWYSDAAH